MPDVWHGGKLPPNDVAEIQQHITDTCREFTEWSDVELGKWGLASVVAAWQIDARLGSLAAIGVDVVNHIRAGGGFILTEPSAEHAGTKDSPH